MNLPEYREPIPYELVREGLLLKVVGIIEKDPDENDYLEIGDIVVVDEALKCSEHDENSCGTCPCRLVSFLATNKKGNSGTSCYYRFATLDGRPIA